MGFSFTRAVATLGFSPVRGDPMLDLNEMHEQRAREQRDRTLAVIAEFGGERRQPMLVPKDDPCNNEVMMRLAKEVLFLRDQIQRLGTRVLARDDHASWF
jgi:hypothetical protein